MRRETKEREILFNILKQYGTLVLHIIRTTGDEGKGEFSSNRFFFLSLKAILNIRKYLNLGFLLSPKLFGASFLWLKKLRKNKYLHKKSGWVSRFPILFFSSSKMFVGREKRFSYKFSSFLAIRGVCKLRNTKDECWKLETFQKGLNRRFYHLIICCLWLFYQVSHHLWIPKQKEKPLRER